MPYEGAVDPATEADASDPPGERLPDISAASPGRRSRDPVRKSSLSAATHHVSWSEVQEAVVRSELILRNTSKSVATWHVPVGGAEEISATLDGRPVPVFIEASGQQAAVQVPPAGSYKIQLRRTVDVTRDAQIERIVVPGQSHALGRARRWKGSARRSGPFGTQGASVTLQDESIAAELGPTDRVEIRRSRAPARGPTSREGDRGGHRALGHRTGRRFSARPVHLPWDPEALERELPARTRPDRAEARDSGHDRSSLGRDRGRADRHGADRSSPLRRRPVRLRSVARPLDVEGPRPDGGATEPAQAGGPGRACPRLEPIGFERYNGLLGVRRPGDWTGRLGSDAGANPLGDESFVKAWGALPDERLTLAGTTRLDFKKLPTLRTGPAAPRARIKPTTQLRIDSGRIDFLFEAELSEVSGSLDHLVVELPRELTIVSVESDGLTDWSRAEDRRLLLRYDRPSRRRNGG